MGGMFAFNSGILSPYIYGIIIVYMNTTPDPYQCTECLRIYVVRELARCCELKHQGVVFVRDPRQEPRPKKPKD